MCYDCEWVGRYDEWRVSMGGFEDYFCGGDWDLLFCVDEVDNWGKSKKFVLSVVLLSWGMGSGFDLIYREVGVDVDWWVWKDFVV